MSDPEPTKAESGKQTLTKRADKSGAEKQASSLRRKLVNSCKEIQVIMEQSKRAISSPLNENDVFLFMGMANSLETQYKIFNSLWDELADLSDEVEEIVFPTSKENDYRSTVRNYYYACLSAYAAIRKRESSDLATSTPAAGTSHHNASFNDTRSRNLPKIQLPSFDGQLLHWTKFRDTYISLVHEDPYLSNMDKFHYLRTSLKGSALSAISHLALEEQNYVLAWKAVVSAFDNRRLLAAAYLDQLINLKQGQVKGNYDPLKTFLSIVSDTVSAFRLLQVQDEADFILFHLAVRWLDPGTRELFEMTQKGVTFPKFESLSSFVRERSMALELANFSNPIMPTFTQSARNGSSLTMKHGVPPRPKPPPRTALLTNTQAKSNITSKAPGRAPGETCFVCKSGAHDILSCERYFKSTPAHRRELLKGWTGCLNCLGISHNVQACKSKWTCRFCTTRHHSSLHIFPTALTSHPDPLQQQTTSQQMEDHGTPFCAVSSVQGQVILGTALASVQDIRGQYQTVRMVLDSGSQNSYITHHCLSKLGLPMTRMNQKIRGIGQTIFDGAKGKTVCSLRPINGNTSLTTEAIVVSTITSYLPSLPISVDLIRKCKDFELADPQFWKPGPVDFLLGVDLFTEIWTGTVTSLDDSSLRLFASIFGHVVMGKVPIHPDNSTTSLLMVNRTDNLNFQLERFWQLEEPIPRKPLSDPLELKCEEHFLATHYRANDGRYIVRLPFKDDHPKVGDSSAVALRRFFNLEKRLDKSPSTQQKYSDFMDEYLALDHMELTTAPSKFIIPHHCVLKEGIEGAKLRVVFDASVSVAGGSLNEHLLVGQKLHNDIRDVILRFRRHKVAFTTDIVKMFRMIGIDPSDRQYLHIYWRFKHSDPVQKYEMKTVTYGLSCAPFLANRVLKQLVTDEGELYPEASTAVAKDLYVDDVLTGADTLTGAMIVLKQLQDLLAKGGFSLSKWTSNSPDLLSTVSQSKEADVIDMSPKEDHWIKILGLQWDSSADFFSFTIHLPKPTYTKRGILSTIARLYDPLGFLTPTTFLMKNFVQELWKLSLNWDQTIPNSLAEAWRALMSELDCISRIRIPRHVNTMTGHDPCQIVGFCDASMKGYAAVLYLRVKSCTGWNVSLLTAKSKLAPTKTISVPRLELCGATLLTDLFASIQNFIEGLQQPVMAPVLCSDSSIVLTWLNTAPYNLKVFVANRVAKIQECTEPCSWRHVISEENPCDSASRGLLPSQLVEHGIWWNGPDWLYKDEEEWPQPTFEVPTEIPEVKEQVHTLLAACNENKLIPWMSRLSSFHTLIRAAGWIRRWIHNCQQEHQTRRQGPLLKTEYDAGLLMCIRAVQYHFFQGKSVVEKYANLLPFQDAERVWRVGGRLRNATMAASRRHPILLPYHAHFTSLLVDYHHRIYHHPGPSTLQAILQRKYWVPSMRRLIRHRGFHCLRCYKSKSAPVAPMMGDLPSYRVNGGRAFTHVGVDFAGPFILKESSRRKAATGKVYLCLFVCMATKALHLEAVTRLSTDAFLASFDRFSSRRGLPSDVYSDCGSNFLGAANYLRDLYKWLSSASTKQELLDYAMETNLRWHFNPPQTPHMGGIWEAGVKSVKRHLRLIAGNNFLTFEEISTWFAKIEAILNSRPLCPLSSSPEETDYLSPGHFLVGGSLLAPPEPTLLDRKENLLNRWQLITRMGQQFWKRWSSEYLATLQRRPKWFQPKKNLEVGDLVLLKEDLPPLQWKTARVTATHPGKDGTVRVVTIKTPTGSFKRPVVRLVPLLPLVSPPFP